MSVVWQYFKASEVNPRYAVCNTCSSEISRGGTARRAFNTTNLIAHLKSRHKVLYMDYLQTDQRRRSQAAAAGTPAPLDAAFKRDKCLPADSTKAKRITSKVMEFLTLDELPFALLEGVGFRSLMKFLEPRYTLPSRRHVAELYSSGLCSENSPLFDDLFGFSVQDVEEEVRRGSRLWCSKCKKTGATAGCEVRRCSKSFHYPCAVEEGAETVEDPEKGSFVLYCQNHSQRLQDGENGSLANGASPKASSSTTSTDKAGESETFCVASKNGEGGGDVSHDGLSIGIVTSYCGKHERNSHATGASVGSVHPNSSIGAAHTATKRCFGLLDRKRPLSNSLRESSLQRSSFHLPTRLRSNNSPPSHDPCGVPSSHTPDQCLTYIRHVVSEDEEEIPSKRQSKIQMIPDDCSDCVPAMYVNAPTEDFSGSLHPAVKEEVNSDLTIFAPLESDIDENTNSVPEQQAVDCENKFESEGTVQRRRLLTNVRSSPRSPSPANPVSIWSTPEQVVLSEESALSPSPNPVSPAGQSTAVPCDPAAVPDHSPDPGVSDPPVCTTSCAAHCSSTTQTAAPTDQKPLSSSRFWKSCNAAGVTEGIFKDFIDMVNDISRRIQSDVASQEDYDMALSVIQTSGKLTEFVTKQQNEIKRKEREVVKAAAAMADAVAALTAATKGT